MTRQHAWVVSILAILAGIAVAVVDAYGGPIEPKPPIPDDFAPLELISNNGGLLPIGLIGFRDGSSPPIDIDEMIENTRAGKAPTEQQETPYCWGCES